MKKLFIILGIILIIFGVVYTRYMSDGLQPQTIVDQPIPLLDGSQTDPSGTNSTGDTNSVVLVPTTQVDQKFPQAIIATETISQSLDTETKRIKGAYSFESLGAIKIGEFSQGVSGEVAISPDGITAKNVNGDTTFSLDGTTGDATFAGTVKAGNVEVIDDSGLISLNNFSIGNTHGVPGLNTTSSSFQDVPTSHISLDLVRITHVLVFMTVSLGTDFNGGSGQGVVQAQVDIDSGSYIGSSAYFAIMSQAGAVQTFTTTVQNIFTLPAGNHTLTIKYAGPGSGGWKGYLTQFSLTYVILGK